MEKKNRNFWLKMALIGSLVLCVAATIAAIAMLNYVFPMWEDSHVSRATERRWHEREGDKGAPSRFSE
jgi:hypothetical protein